jgi:MinD-like ATPase involved in chromosome partitioning or flagellar assembly
MTGSIISFYSYKGGVGRSFLLANVAVLLARWGYRVLCIDWDIEAPGLDEYFRPWLGPRERPGLVDLVARFSAERSADWRAHVSTLQLPGTKRALDLITAGTPGTDLATRIQAIDWRDLYDNQAFGAYVETMRCEWKEAYDLVLVDCRTGITDIGGICTVHLPDILVAVFTANQQNLGGVKHVIEMAEARRSKLPLSRAGLLTLPVPARFDARGQDELAKEWLRRIADELDSLYESWLDAEVSPRQFLDVSRIPYFSVWTFGERLAVLEERDNDPECISYHFATIAALLARGLEGAGQLCRSRDAYVDVAQHPAQFEVADRGISPFEFDYYVSYSPENAELASEVATVLRSAGHSAFLDTDAFHHGRGFRAAVEGATQRCRHLVMLRSSLKSSPWQLSEIMSFADQGRTHASRQIYDVQLTPAVPDLRGASFLEGVEPRRFHRIDAAFASPEAIVDRILPGGLRLSDVPVDDLLRGLAEQYMNVRIEDYAERVRAKDQLAEEMGAHIRAQHISRDALVRARHDGLTVGLAEAARIAPQPGDLVRLLAAGIKVGRLHTAYRVLVAINAIVERERIRDNHRLLLNQLLWVYQRKAHHSNDEPLAALAIMTDHRLRNLT